MVISESRTRAFFVKRAPGRHPYINIFDAIQRFEDGCINLQELISRITEDVANGVMAAEAEMYAAGASARKVECAVAKLGIDAETRPRAERLGRLPWKRPG